MLYGLSTPTYDPFGHLMLDCLPSQNDGEVRRRVNRSPTLDGGVAVNDFGFSDADRNIELRWELTSRTEAETAQSMVIAYDRLILSTPSGVFLAAPESYSATGQEAVIRLLVVERLSE